MSPTGPARATRAPRPRIRSADAPLVRARVQAAADELGLRCGAAAVLTAVLALTCGYKRLRDNTVAIRHVAARLPAGTRLSATTIGRLLARLADLQLIEYRPARGRGATAQLAIHPRFCDDISELSRTSNGGRVTGGTGSGPHNVDPGGADPDPGQTPDTPPCQPGNVEFFPAEFLIESFPRKTTTPPTPPADPPAPNLLGPRPTEVPVHNGALRQVLASLPDCYRATPAPVRWRLGQEITDRLARGWQPHHITAILAAPLPEPVHKPLQLARWRLAHNMPGPGPRLAGLQRAWDRAHAGAERATHQHNLQASYTELITTLGAGIITQLAAAADRRAAHTLGHTPGQHTDSTQQPDMRSAAVHGARMACRAHPHLPLPQAVTAWLADNQPAPSPPAATSGSAPGAAGGLVADLIAATPAGCCVACGSPGAITRAELPLPVPVCGGCWTTHTNPAHHHHATA